MRYEAIVGALAIALTNGVASASAQQPRPPIVDCSGPMTFNANSNHACFDDRPRAVTRTTAELPSTCPYNTIGAIVLVHISAAGQVIGPAPMVTQSSNCRTFDSIAVAQIQESAFRPAKKNGQAVAGWLLLRMQPRRSAIKP
jgi:outer membrane biosynthesis protein TonB